MSLFGLLGAPQTVEAFAERAKWDQLNEVDVKTSYSNRSSPFNGSLTHRSSLHLEAGKLKSNRISIHYRTVQGNNASSTLHECQQEATQEAVKIARTLSDYGFRATVDGISIDRATLLIEDYNRTIKAYRDFESHHLIT